jgi:uncharacterized protein (TIGR02147 family)
LSIDKTSIELALTRLIRLNLVKFENDRYVKLLDNQVEDVPSLAIREFHKNMIKKAYLSITQQKYNERDITGTVISINSDKLPEAKEKIKKFRQEMNELLEQGNKRDRLYQLNVQLFRLDKDL